MDKHNEILLLQQICEQRDQTIQVREQEIKNKRETVITLQQACDQRNQDLQDKEQMIQTLKQICDEREQLIILLDQRVKFLERASLVNRGVGVFQSVLIGAKNKTRELFLDKPNAKIQSLKQAWNQPHIGILYHHPPKSLRLPKRYYRHRSLKSPPTISIVTPSFRHAGFIERTIQSVLEQKYPCLEYIIQDGASNDGTLDILQKYAAQLKHFESVADDGQTHAINLGFRHAGGEIMAYLNSDDLLLPGALMYVAAYFSKHPEVDVVYGQRVLIDEQDQEVGRWILPPHDDKVLSWADFVPQETLFWRRSIWDKVGGQLDESFKFAMDWDLILRFRDAGAKFVRLPRFLGGFRVHPQQKSSAVISTIGIQEMGRLRERCLGRAVTEEEIGRGIEAYVKQHLFYDKMYKLFR